MPTSPSSRSGEPMLLHVLALPELAEEIVRLVASAAALARMRGSCRLVRGAVDRAVASLTAPRLLLSRFVSDPRALADALRASDALLTGVCVRTFMHTFQPGERYCEVVVPDRGHASISSHLVGDGYAPAATSGDLLHAQRAFSGLASDYRLFIGGPSGKAAIAVVVAVHGSLQLFLASPSSRNMQAFDGTTFVDLYPAFGNEGPAGTPGEPMLSDISFDDAARFIGRRPSDLAVSLPGAGLVVVQRRLGDQMCYVFPSGQLTEAARTNTWEVRLRVNRDAACSIIVDAEIVTRIPLVRTYVATPGFAEYARLAYAHARRQIMVGEMEEPPSWDRELDVLLSAFCANSPYKSYVPPGEVAYRQVRYIVH